jgi:hypothetical protein
MGALPEIGSPKLSGFEVWDRTIQAPAGTERKEAFVSVLMSGGFGINKVARRMLGPVEAVRVMYDPERKRVGFVPADPEEKGCFLISSWNSAQVTCSKLMEYYGIRVERTTRCYDLEMVDGVLVANLAGVLG